MFAGPDPPAVPDASSPSRNAIPTGWTTAAVTTDPTTLWTDATRTLRGAMDEATYDLWIAPLAPVACTDGVLRLGAPEAIAGWVRTRLRRVIEDAVTAAADHPLHVEIVPTDTGSAPAHRTDTAAPSAQPAPVPHDDGPGLNPKFTFEQFVLGDANRFAHAGALAAAEMPGQAYNPLFLYGPPGVGKTHLLHAIGNYVAAHEPGLTIRCTTAEHFTNDFVGALADGGIGRFKARYRRVDLLLIDDVQFLERKARTEEEFFHTFNALRDAGGQVVLTSDRLPRDLDALEERLRERFEAGLVTAISPPDDAMRMAVLRKRAAVDGLPVTDDALLPIAARVTANVRALEAALVRVVAYASLTGQPLDAELSLRVLDDLYPAPARAAGHHSAITADDVIALVAESFSLTPDDLRSSSREARLAWPRQLAMYLAREHTDQSLPAIARAFGARAHTTVLHACRRTAGRLETDSDAGQLVAELSGRLTGAKGDR
jgi:chromosomal replication initiator protein